MTQTPLDAPCPCASGRTFVECCGHLDPRIWDEHALGRMPGNLTDPQWKHLVANQPQCEYRGELLPPGVLVKDLSDSYHWQGLAHSVCEKSNARAARTNASGTLQKSVWRETEIVAPEENSDKILELVRILYRDEAEPFFGRKLRSLESPHVLRYTVGSYYRPHADSDDLNLDTQRWEKKLDRDLSLLFYLDDDYEGGEIVFPNFNFRIRPQAGTLLMFPSDCRYLHGVLPVTQGVRHTIVSWCALEP
ncbi:2OG-Fe(II) oxygenase [Congregibacter brevis]|uniref:2OG-Fe(II) oxygenase n=1 Tax=Congregibacter brevis TaxID=3081201 RepID=A0ABZ0IE51_9GAMM|nr:2OG-Fe(II) oxygenase [Congregibacter sp. IMCC45268]